MNEIKATLQNRIQLAFLDLKIKKIERDKILTLTRTNRFISDIENDLENVRASTGRLKFTDVTETKMKKLSNEKLSLKSSSECSFSDIESSLSEFDKILPVKSPCPTPKKINMLFSKSEVLLPYRIDELKKKDPVFSKRYRHFEFSKQYGRVPLFSEHDNKIHIKLTKSVIERKKKELIKLSNENLKKLNQNNERNKNLNEKVSCFIKNYQLIT
ncbi:unnamed protein product [Brachionus calyciflorus]|uniref:Uncharacterized protein n=1 Tax=Brachionus calyciflorus TaxID=104777 RepID=A0A814KU11_9BILA|nr:unnamed protein product [Brachionus calyciflorus]